ncbi:MAG TPA: FxLYD domain-containing protein [Rhodothermales bacterium]|nr:FxLYD domain-containing protein [Rhodothermales bacterium]
MLPRKPASKRPAYAPPVWQTVALVLGATALLFGAVFLYRVLDTRQGGLLKEMPTRSATPRTLGLAGLHYDRQARVIVGRVRNYTGRVYENVAVRFELLDAQQQVVGTAADSVAAVAPDSTWRFRIPVSQTETVRVRLVHYAGTPEGGPRKGVDMTLDV